MSEEKSSRAVVLHKATMYIKQLEEMVLSQSAEETALRHEVEELRRQLLVAQQST